MKRFGQVAGLLAVVCLVAIPLGAQEQQPIEGALNLYFDCQGGSCYDSDFFRREVPIVNWVVDREVSDVHVLVTSQRTGGGGQLYTLAFIGRGRFEGQDQQLTATASGDATTDEQRNAIAEQLKVGLVRYLAGTPAAAQIRVMMAPPPGGPGGPRGPGGPQAANPEDDRWNFWVFNISGNGFVNGQESSSFADYFGTVSANRTTEAWKISLGGNYSRSEQRFEIPVDEETVREVKEVREDWGVNSGLVRSIGAQWALGVGANAGSSTYFNRDFQWSVKPGVEFNLFPYSESSRRSLTLQYLVGPTHFDYTETTIFDEDAETRMQQDFIVRLSLIEPWGRWSTSINSQQYLHDTDYYSVTFSGTINVRLFQGFSVRVSGNYSRIRDQLHISAARLSDEQILLQQRQLQTGYRYFTSFGISYQFGSIFNNVVNPRFGNSGGTFFIG